MRPNLIISSGVCRFVELILLFLFVSSTYVGRLDECSAEVILVLLLPIQVGVGVFLRL